MHTTGMRETEAIQQDNSSDREKPRKIRVFIVEDQQPVRDSLRMFLNFSGEFEVVGEASNGREALERIPSFECDIVMVDITMPIMDGFETIRNLRPLKPKLRILVFTADPNAEADSMKVGAHGFLSKTDIPQLIETLRLLARGKVHYDAAVLTSILGVLRATPTTLRHLSQREQEVLTFIADGLSNREIASRLDLSTRTVETHRRRIMDTLNIHGTVGLTKFAIRNGLVEA